MKHLIKISTCLIFALVLMTSCTKETDDCVCPSVYEPVFDKEGKEYANACLAECAGVAYSEFSPETQATVWFNKTVEAGGCKWFIRIKDKDYRMSNLDKDFYKDGLSLWISYKVDLTPPDTACDPSDTYIEMGTVRVGE